MRTSTAIKGILAIAIIAFLGVWAAKNFSPEPTGNVVSESTEEVKLYALQEVAQHNNKEDCWIVLHDKVYDVTEFIAGGAHGPAIQQGCGKDGTELYETRPMGSGKPHSENARKLAEKYYIGDLKK